MLPVEHRPIQAGRVEQFERSYQIGVNERTRAVDGAIDVRFRRQIENHVGSVLSQQLVEQDAIRQISMHEVEVGLMAQGGKVIEIAGVGEQVEHDQIDIRASQQTIDEIGSDKSCSAGNQDSNHGCA